MLIEYLTNTHKVVSSKKNEG